MYEIIGSTVALFDSGILLHATALKGEAVNTAEDIVGERSWPFVWIYSERAQRNIWASENGNVVNTYFKGQ